MLFETPKEIAYNTAKRFRALRKKRGFTVKRLSEDSGIPYSTLRRFDSTGEISFVSLVKLSSILDAEDDIRNLFAKEPPSSIEEIIRENSRKA